MAEAKVTDKPKSDNNNDSNNNNDNNTEMFDGGLKCVFEYKVTKPLILKAHMINKSKKNLYFNKYRTPWDDVVSSFIITDENNKKGKYIGIKKKRKPANVSKDAWIFIRKGQMIKIKCKLQYELQDKTANNYKVESTFGETIQCAFKLNKINGKIESFSVPIQMVGKVV